MKIKVKNRVYDSADGPVAVMLSDSDKANIADMHPECTIYIAYPKAFADGVDLWIEEFKEHGKSEEGTA